jgi:peptide/nickel transport system substrate-binding protein
MVVSGCSHRPTEDCVRLGMPWEPVSFNPVRGIDSGSYSAASLVYDGLVAYDEAMNPRPALAESYQISDDGLVYTFVLKDKLKFCDGAPVTVYDVKKSLEYGGSKYSPFKSDYQDICAIEVDQASRKVLIRLDRRCEPLISRLSELRILPARIIDLPDHGNRLLSRSPIGTGAYRLQDWRSGESLTFVRNQYYWGPKPAIEKIIWRIVPDRNVTAAALARGELDIAPMDGRTWCQFLSNHRTVRPLVASVYNGNRTIYLGFNLERKPWSDIRVRRAIASCIDRKSLSAVLYGGIAVVPDADVPITNWAFSHETSTTPYDPEAAAKELVLAGYVQSQKILPLRGMQKSWIDKRDGKPLAFRLMTIKDHEAMAQVVADDLKRQGIACEVEIVEYSSLRRTYMAKGRYDAVIWSRSFGPDPECSIVWKTGGSLNFCRYSDPQSDNLIVQARQAGDKQTRKALYSQLQDRLSKQLPWVFILQPKLLIVHREDLVAVQRGQQTYVGMPWDNPAFNARYWHFAKSR